MTMFNKTLVAMVLAATVFGVRPMTAQAQTVDVRAELGYPNEPPYETCKLLEANNRAVGPGPELTIADEIPVLGGCLGAVGVDVGEDNTIQVFVIDEGFAGNINYEEIRLTITFHGFDIATASLLNQNLFDVGAGSPDPAPVISVNSNILTITWTAPSPSPIFGDEFLLKAGGTAILECAPPDPVALLEDLVTDTVLVNLGNGISNSLDAKLDTSLAALDDSNDNNDVAACKSIEAFINSVEAQSGKKISEADADYLILAAMEILELLGCP